MSSNQDIENIDPTYFILNEKNQYITREYIEDILKKYSVEHKVKHLETFKRALIHKSYLLRDEEYYKQNRTKNTNKDLDPIEDPLKAIPLQNESYERLEYLGDSVIHLILADYLFRRYEKEDEGFMTRLRTKIENGETLAELAKIMGLNKYILLSRYIEKNGGRENNKSILEDSFEAFMAALFLEANFEPCKKFLIQLIEQEIDFAQILNTETNFKDCLLQLFHKRGWEDPSYGVLDISGPDHKKQFTMYVKCRKNPRDDGEIVGIGRGGSKKKGEQSASREAMKHFGVLKDEAQEEDDEFIEEISETEIKKNFIKDSNNNDKNNNQVNEEEEFIEVFESEEEPQIAETIKKDKGL